MPKREAYFFLMYVGEKEELREIFPSMLVSNPSDSVSFLTFWASIRLLNHFNLSSSSFIEGERNERLPHRHLS